MLTLSIDLTAEHLASLATLANITEKPAQTSTRVLEHVRLTVTDPHTGAWTAIATDRYAIAQLSITPEQPPTFTDFGQSWADERASWDDYTEAERGVLFIPYWPAEGVSVLLPRATLTEAARSIRVYNPAVISIALDPEVLTGGTDKRNYAATIAVLNTTRSYNAPSATDMRFPPVDRILATAFSTERTQRGVVAVNPDTLAKLAKVRLPEDAMRPKSQRRVALSIKINGDNAVAPAAVLWVGGDQREPDWDSAEHVLRMAFQTNKLG